MFLATTALKEFWKTDKPILFLGEWCLKYKERNKWESLSYEVLKYPWQDRELLSSAIQYCTHVYESVLDRLVEYMNRIHLVKYSPRYWRIILGPWLIYFTHTLYDRYICLRLAFERYPELNTILLSSESFVTPCNYYDFLTRCADDPYNMQLYTQILENMGYSYPSKRLSISNNLEQTFSLNRRIKIFLKKKYGRFLGLLSSGRPILLYDLHFRQSDIWRLCFYTGFKAWPVTYEGKYETGAEELPVDNNLRNKFQELQTQSDDRFMKVLLGMLPTNLPVCYLEGYERIRECANRVIDKRTCGIVSTFGWASNEHFKFTAAEASERGVVLFGVQHGGASGINKYTAGDEHIIANSDVFYTWGWTDKSHSKARPLPDPGLQSLRNTGETILPSHNGMPALFVGTLFSRYLHYFRYCPLGPQVKQYIEWQIRFLRAVPDGMRDSFTVRLYPSDFGWANKSRLSNRVGNLNFDDGSVSYQERVKQCKLVVIDNCQTTYLETMLLNRPVILFYDPAFWDVSEEAEPYLENLQKAGILYYNPESAAQKVTEVFNAPGTWWYSDTVQAARKEFVDYFAVSAENWLDLWEKELLSCSVCGKQDKE
ncbi:MAG: LIC12162 family transferase [Thermodesulfobacteriota bacterium]